MAPGRGRLGPLLIPGVADVLRVLDATPAPRGQERAAATALRDWCAARWPDIDWTVQPYGGAGANLIASAGPGPLLYSHLDTSLDGTGGTEAGTGTGTGTGLDAAVTGRRDPVGGLAISGRRVTGFGLGVARGPAAAALLGFVAARRGRLLLAGSGTHRRGGDAEGLRAYLAALRSPVPAAIVAKGGPDTILWEEPGAAYVQVRVTGRPGAALAPDSAWPAGGVAAHAGLVLAALAAWRSDYLRSRQSTARGQTGPQAGIGAVRAGWPGKPDLLPAELVVDLYVVTMPGEDTGVLGEQVASTLREHLRTTALACVTVAVTVEPVHAAAATRADAPIVVAARRAWMAEFGSPPAPVSGWAGSTDGVVLRAHGIDTVRLGPAALGSATDPRRDVLDLDRLAAFTRIYTALLRS